MFRPGSMWCRNPGVTGRVASAGVGVGRRAVVGCAPDGSLICFMIVSAWSMGIRWVGVLASRPVITSLRAPEWGWGGPGSGPGGAGLGPAERVHGVGPRAHSQSIQDAFAAAN